jgi:hypothetical protein
VNAQAKITSRILKLEIGDFDHWANLQNCYCSFKHPFGDPKQKASVKQETDFTRQIAERQATDHTHAINLPKI